MPSKCHSYDITNSDLPLRIKKSGAYYVKENLCFKNCKAAITIECNKSVTILGSGYTLNLKNSGGAGILLINSNNVIIKGLNIKNTGKPDSNNLQPTIPDPLNSLEYFEALFPTTSIAEAQQVTLQFTINNIQNPLLLSNSLSYAAIAFAQGNENILIENCNFSNNFIDIVSAYRVINLTIKKCRSNQVGYNYPELGESSMRGGSVILFNPYNQSNQSSNDYVIIDNLLIKTDRAQFGVATYFTNNVTVSNTNIQLSTGQNGVGSSESNCIGLFYCNYTTEFNNITSGGQDGTQHIGCNNGTITNCKHTLFTDQGIDVDTANFYQIKNCTITNNLINNTPDPNNNKSIGISALISTNINVEENFVDNVNNPEHASPFISAGIELIADTCIVRANRVINSGGGILAAQSSNCQVNDNITNDNFTWGLGLLSASGTLPNVSVQNNQFYRNESAGNNPFAVVGLGNFSIDILTFSYAIPCVVSASECPIVGRVQNIEP